MSKICMLLSLAVVVSSVAQAQLVSRPYSGTIQRATPSFVAPVEVRSGKIVEVGPRRPYLQSPLGSEPPRKVVFDAQDVDLYGNDPFGHKYGVDGTVVQFQEDAVAPAWINDMFAVPAMQGRVCYDWGANFIWNPDGSSPIGGTANMVLLFLVGDYYGYNGFPFSSAGGWALFFDNFPSGYWGVGVSGLPLSMPWTNPDRPACLIAQLATYDPNNILPTPGAAQFMQFQMLSPTEPNPEYVGTNQSDSTGSCWIDVNNDFQWGTEEVFNLENDYPFGRTQPMTCLLVNSADPVFSGRLNFLGVDPDTLRPIHAIRVQTRIHGQSPFNGDPLVREEYIFLGPNGEFRATGPQTPGSYDISFQGDHFLRKTVGPLVISGPGTTINVGTVNMKNGNADHFEDSSSPSTTVDIGDYAVLSQNFGQSWPYSSYDAETCDLNRDDSIDIGDYAILSSNYGIDGDD